MVLSIKIFILAILFILTGGSFFYEKFSKYRYLTLPALLISLLGSIYLINDVMKSFEKVVDKRISQAKTEKEKTEKPQKITSAFSKGITFLNLIKQFSLFDRKQNENYNMGNWFDGAKQDSPVKWLHAGLEESKDNKNGPYYRRGQVILLKDNKPSHMLLEKNLVPGLWTINLIGAGGGYTNLKVESDNFTHELKPGMFITSHTKQYFKKVAECSWGGTGSAIYKVLFKNKKNSWMLENWSCGSRGCGLGYSLKTFRHQLLVKPSEWGNDSYCTDQKRIEYFE